MGRVAVIAVAVSGILVSACGGGMSSTPKAAHMRSVTVAMGFIPNVQFAPFYVAQVKGYYRKAGLSVRFNYGIEPDLLKLASAGKVDFVVSGGDEVLTAGAHGLKVKYVMTQYSRFPSALFALRSSGIRSVRDLRGRSIGIPGAYGASYAGLLVLLHRAGIRRNDVSIRSVGFTQVESVAHHKVDAAVGYAMNEPVQLRHQHFRTSEFDIWKWANIAGAGIAAGDQEIARHPDDVRAFVRATLHGLRDTLRAPRQAYGISARAIKIHSEADFQRAVLMRSLDFWRPERGHPVGWVDPRIWRDTARLLLQFQQIPRPLDASRFYTNQFVLTR